MNRTSHICFAAITGLLAAALTLHACGSGDPKEEQCEGESCAPPAEQPPDQPPDEKSTSSYTGRCCLDGSYYSCSSKAAFDLCAGGDPVACHAKCSFSDFQCHTSCDDAAMNAKHDPSQCTRVSARDGDCPATTINPGGTCVGSHNGMACSYSTQCPGGYHCSNGKCYSNATGNPCSYSTQCNSGNCTDGCCRGTSTGSACTYSTQCGSGLHCTGGRCYSGARGNPCSYSTECTSGNCTDGRCQ